jgi:hypothetical protein
MNGLFTAVRHLPRAAALSLATITASIGVAAPAVAATDHALSIRGTAACDSAAREWVVTWTLTNQSDVAGTFGNVRAYPADRALTGLPSRIAPGETVTGVQRLLASEYTGSIVLDVNWDDGAVTYNQNWPIYIHMYCAAA